MQSRGEIPVSLFLLSTKECWNSNIPGLIDGFPVHAVTETFLRLVFFDPVGDFSNFTAYSWLHILCTSLSESREDVV